MFTKKHYQSKLASFWGVFSGLMYWRIPYTKGVLISANQFTKASVSYSLVAKMMNVCLSKFAID